MFPLNILKNKSPQPPLQKRVKPVDPQLVDRDMQVLESFVRVYCRRHHAEYGGGILCHECQDLLDYARNRREHCPYDPKPKCKECPTHCYKPSYRERVRTIMRFSGMYFVKRGRLDWLVKYFLRG
ncbi:MAG: nitrous oxide-stimulated promoter family protein [Candidatus Omnitrophota bacterium]